MKKYQQYKISVTYINGDKEEINYKGINTSNYKDMIKLYSDIKDEYSDKSATIDFVGISTCGELKVFWSKKIESKEETIETEELSSNNISIEDILTNIKANLELLIEKETIAYAKQGILDKQQDVELHRVENIDNGIFISEEEKTLEKVKVFDSIQNIRKERRLNKNNISLNTNISNKINKKQIINDISSILGISEIANNKKYEYLTDKRAEEFSIVKKVKFRTERERISLTSQLQPKYSKVYYENGEILCYNKAK